MSAGPVGTGEGGSWIKQNVFVAVLHELERGADPAPGQQDAALDSRLAAPDVGKKKLLEQQLLQRGLGQLVRLLCEVFYVLYEVLALEARVLDQQAANQ
jgi:hypothetical protein